MPRPYYIKTQADLSSLYGALYTITIQEFLALGFTDVEWHDGFRKDRLGFVCVQSRHARGSMHLQSREQRAGALFHLVIERANGLRGVQ